MGRAALGLDANRRGGPTVTLYGTPGGGAYRVLGSAGFGAPLDLPAPFRLTVAVG
ncbi:hypothetical protein [Streptomyces sp. LaBMicrA B280]|uniref:hypothetical protein n=1 Tax=Streptomyces sp. LaBMicrA B280 TaxID=3391001 RepID=UPI003BA6C01A